MRVNTRYASTHLNCSVAKGFDADLKPLPDSVIIDLDGELFGIETDEPGTVTKAFREKLRSFIQDFRDLYEVIDPPKTPTQRQAEIAIQQWAEGEFGEEEPEE